MPKRSMEILTESMFYVLMALNEGPRCGIDIAQFVESRTAGRVKLGPATLYTVLAKFEKEKYIEETETEGRKRTYTITSKGTQAYVEEISRLRSCLKDAIKGGAMNDQV